MTWTDQAKQIQILTKTAQQHMAMPCLLAKDPAVSDVGVNLQTGAVWLRHNGSLRPELQQKLASVKQLSNDCMADDNVYFLKLSSTRVSDLTRPAADFFSYARNMVGGPSAVTNTLVGSGLAALGGYGVGSAIDAVVPPTLQAMLPGGHENGKHDLIGRSHWASTLGTLGAIGGALPGLAQTGAALSTGNSPMTNYPWLKNAADAMEDMPFQEAMSSTGALFQPSIPVDAFNKAIWASATPNTFGTKSGWGDNNAPMYTPPQTAAMVGGLVTATGAARGRSHVSPWEVAQVATQAAISGGAGMLVGAATGLMAGKVLGALAGLTPAGQQYAQRTGMWTGLLNGLAQKLF